MLFLVKNHKSNDKKRSMLFLLIRLNLKDTLENQHRNMNNEQTRFSMEGVVTTKSLQEKKPKSDVKIKASDMNQIEREGNQQLPCSRQSCRHLRYLRLLLHVGSNQLDSTSSAAD